MDDDEFSEGSGEDEAPRRKKGRGRKDSASEPEYDDEGNPIVKLKKSRSARSVLF